MPERWNIGLARAVVEWPRVYRWVWARSGVTFRGYLVAARLRQNRRRAGLPGGLERTWVFPGANTEAP